MKNNTKILISAITVLAMGGCSSSFDPKIKVKPTNYVDDLPNKKVDMPSNNGSLYGQGTRPLLGMGSENPLWGDRKALNVNDLLTVVIQETTESKSSGSKKIAKNNSLGLGGGLITTPNGTNRYIQTAANKFNSIANINFKTNSTNSFEGKGENSRSESFETRITVRVLKVMVNDTYYVEGTKQLLINGEQQYIKVGGVIRAEDIGSNNEISSDKIADARILYSTDGDIKDSGTKGWGTKALDAIWPF